MSFAFNKKRNDTLIQKLSKQNESEKRDTLRDLLKEKDPLNQVDATRSHNSDLLIDRLHEIAVEKGLVTQETLDFLNACIKNTDAYAAATTEKRVEILGTIQQEALATLYPQKGGKLNSELTALTNLMVLDSMVLEAVHHYEAAVHFPSPKERFSRYLEGILNQDNAESKLKTLGESLDMMLVSFIHTVHPVGWHSAWGRQNVQQLTELLEGGKVQEQQNQQAIAEEFKSENSSKLWLSKEGEIPPLAVASAGLDTFKNTEALLNSWVEHAKISSAKNNPLTPFNQVTIQEEHLKEVDNLAKIKAAFAEVKNDWDEAVQAMQNKYAQHNDLLETLKVKDKALYEERSWGRTADADGRPASTAVELYRFIHDDVKDGKYTGPILDFRQNSRDHQQLMSSLFQNKYYWAKKGNHEGKEVNKQKFNDFCDEFMQARKENYNNGDNGHDSKDNGNSEKNGRKSKVWVDPLNSIFLQLNDQDKTDFAQEVIKRGYNLIPEQIKDDTLAVVGKYHQTWNQIIKENSVLIKNNWNIIEPNVKRDEHEKDLSKVTFEHLEQIQHNGGYPIATQFKNALEAVSEFTVNNKAFKLGFTFDDYSERMGFRVSLPSEEQDRVSTYLAETDYLNSDGLRTKLKGIDKKGDRAILMNIIRRMVVLKHSIDEFPNDKVATRYQIANFSAPKDFYIMLKLMQETGLAEIEKNTGTVKRTDIGIMPLLETIEDLQNAEKIADALIADKEIAGSYYKARGEKLHAGKPVAEFMVGFSDSAATGGMLGSRWAIFKAMRTLHEKYKKAGIEVRFMRGPGRGTDRGGTVELGVMEDMVPDELQINQLIHDATIQADLPTAMGTSPAHAKYNIASIMLGLLTNRERAKERENDDDVKKQMAEYEKGITWLADKASEIFQETVRKNPAAQTFLAAMPLNKANTSRPTARSEKPQPPTPPGEGATPEQKKAYQDAHQKFIEKSYDDIRMITKEYGFEMADMPAFLVGTREALEKFSAMNQEDLQKLGIHCESGAKFLTEMKNHKFFRGAIEVMRSGIKNYDPAVASMMGELSGQQEFVKTVCSKLNGLDTLLDKLGNPKGFAEKIRQADTHLPPERPLVKALDKIAHGMMAAAHEVWHTMRYDKEDDRQHYSDRLNVINNLYNVLTQLTQTRDNSPELQLIPMGRRM